MTNNEWYLMACVVAYTIVAGLQGWQYGRLARRVRALENPPTFRHGAPMFRPTKPSLN